MEKLVIVGRNKDYVVPFTKGLNIIYGDSDTGKSSILNLIDYLLGASEVDMYNELEINGKYCLLQVSLNGKVFTIKRDIFQPNAHIEVFPSTIEEMDTVFPRQYGPNYKKAGADGYFSDFLLQSLNIPLIKVRRAPTKDDSPAVRLSFRDIFKFCYLNQDDVGSKGILDNKNHSRYVKVKETFKFIHMLLDTQLTDLENEIREKLTLKKQKEDIFNNVSSFFRETKIGTIESLNEELEEITKNLAIVDEKINAITSTITSDTKQFEEIREMIRAFELQIEQNGREKYARELQLEQKNRLKKDYQRDIDKLESSLEFSKKLPKTESLQVDCPICEREMSFEQLKSKLGEDSTSAIEMEIKNLKAHIKSLDNLIEEERLEIIKIEQRISILKENLNRYKEFLDIETHKYISPYVTQRDDLVSQKASLLEQKKRVEYLKKIRTQLTELHTESELLGQQISDLKDKIENIKQTAPSISAVLQDIADHLDEFLKFIPIRNPENIYISESNFLPIIRNREYTKLTSGGLRTLVSIGFFVSLLKNSLLNNTHLPRFLMIDTVGKYLGKTSKQQSSETDVTEDIKEGIGDPAKYYNLYDFFMKLDKKYGHQFQMIIVDNDVPENIEQSLQQYVVKHFRVDSRFDADKGLIDDI